LTGLVVPGMGQGRGGGTGRRQTRCYDLPCHY
jgi:hypothetical protein